MVYVRGGRPGGGTSRQAFLDATAELLRLRGYSATGLSEIVARSGASRGSLYFHFPGGKEELAVAAMAQAGAELRTAVAAIVNSGDDLAESIGWLVDSLAPV